MSAENKSAVKVQIDPAYIIKLTVTLCVTCLVVAFLLGLVDSVTRGPIAESNKRATEEALAAVFTDASAPTFEQIEASADMLSAASSKSSTLKEIYNVTDGGSVIGKAMKIVASGSQGNIEMVVGVDSDGTVTGVSIVSNSETSGIGSKVMTNKPLPNGTGVLDQFKGKSASGGDLSVGSNVDAITGATVSSRGVTAGVNGALAVAALA